MRVWRETEAERTSSENHHIDVERDVFDSILLLNGFERPKRGKIIRWENVDPFSDFSGANVLGGQRMNGKCFANGINLLVGRSRHVKPPKSAVVTGELVVTRAPSFRHEARECTLLHSASSGGEETEVAPVVSVIIERCFLKICRRLISEHSIKAV